MKTNFILHTALVLFVSCFLKTLDAIAKVSESRSKAEIYERYEKPDTSSLAQRQGKVGYLSVQPLGFAVFPVPSIGLNGGFYLDSNRLVQIEASRGKLPFDFFAIDAESLGVNLKYFVGNSFYLKGGGAYRTIAINNVECAACSPGFNRNWGSAKTIAGEFAIGNQWQWENFTLGCDWIGVMVPLTTAGVDPLPSSTSLGRREREELDRSWQQLAKSTSTSFLRFYLGASF